MTIWSWSRTSFSIRIASTTWCRSSARAHVGYLPDGKVVGLSKIARVVDIFAHRLQTQEAMTAQIAGVIQDVLNPRGVAVMIEAEHMCMAMRGIRKQGSTTLTSTFTGAFKDSPEEQVRFVTMVRNGTRANQALCRFRKKGAGNAGS